MVPYSLDGFLNQKANNAKVNKQGVRTTEQTMALNKKQMEMKNTFYEDNGKATVASTSRLFSQENVQTREQSRQESILGFDPDEKLEDSDYVKTLS